MFAEAPEGGLASEFPGTDPGAGGSFAAAVPGAPLIFIWSLTLRTPAVPLAIFMAASSTSEFGTSPDSVTAPSFTATVTPLCLVAGSE